MRGDKGLRNRGRRRSTAVVSTNAEHASVGAPRITIASLGTTRHRWEGEALLTGRCLRGRLRLRLARVSHQLLVLLLQLLPVGLLLKLLRLALILRKLRRGLPWLLLLPLL